MPAYDEGVCKMCQQYSTVLLGTWCWQCYCELLGEKPSGRPLSATDPEREPRIKRLEELAAEGKPLFEERRAS